jgi:hypothetical protein
LLIGLYFSATLYLKSVRFKVALFSARILQFLIVIFYIQIAFCVEFPWWYLIPIAYINFIAVVIKFFSLAHLVTTLMLLYNAPFQIVHA